MMPSMEFWIRFWTKASRLFNSWVILTLLAAVALSLYLAGQRYDPDLFALNPSLLPEEAQTQTVALTASVPGWQQLGPTEEFTAQTLYERINGRAEQYLAYDVEGLTCISLAASDGTDAFIDVYVYDMGSPLRSFGIFSVERAPDEPVVDLGRGGYRAGASHFLWHGRYYVQVMPSDHAEPFERAALAVATQLVEGLPDAGEPVQGSHLLPAAGRVPRTERFLLRDALSLDFLANTWTAQYLYGDVEVASFVSPQTSPEEAVRVLQSYRGYLMDFGAATEYDPGAGSAGVVGDLGGYYDIVFQRGAAFAGVTMVPDLNAAQRAAADLWLHLEASDSGRQ